MRGGAAAPLRRGGAPGHRPRGAGALRGRGRRAAAARRSGALLRGRGHARRARARRRGDPRARPRGHAARPDRSRLPVARPLARAGRDGVRDAEHPVRARGPPAFAADRVRPRAARAAPLRLARGRPAPALRLPALSVLGAAPRERRLRRGPPARARDRLARPCGGGGRGTARRPYPRARFGPRGRVAGRRRACARALDGASVRGAAGGEPGRVAVLDLLRARTRRFDALFVLGLEEGGLPRRGDASPFLDEDARRRLGGRLQRPDPVARDRSLFYTACARPSRRLYLVREAAGDEGSPREPSPFWDEVVSLFPRDDVQRWTRRRPLSALTWPLEAAPTERERLRALAGLSAGDGEERDSARAVARANGWERRLERALSAFRRRTRLRHPLVLEQLRARGSFNVTELERFADCSSAWFFDRVVDPRTIDAEVDPKLRGSVAHTALHRFFAGLPKELGIERVDEAHVEPAVAFMHRCVEQALAGVRMEMTEMQRRELEQGLRRDLEQLVREEALAQLPLVPPRFEVAFGSERPAPEPQPGPAPAEGVPLGGEK